MEAVASKTPLMSSMGADTFLEHDLQYNSALKVEGVAQEAEFRVMISETLRAPELSNVIYRLLGESGEGAVLFIIYNKVYFFNLRCIANFLSNWYYFTVLLIHRHFCSIEHLLTSLSTRYIQVITHRYI